MGFPEGSDMKAPGDSSFPFGAFFALMNKTYFLIRFVLSFESKKKGEIDEKGLYCLISNYY
jgi:hypothetical protein